MTAVNLAHNYSPTWDPSLSAKLRTIIADDGDFCCPCEKDIANYHAGIYNKKKTEKLNYKKKRRNYLCLIFSTLALL